MIVRVARHTSNLNKAIDFYTTIIGLQIIGQFKNHNGYDGVFFGEPNSDWQLEFTISNTPPKHTFDEDDLLVFYPTSIEKYNKIISTIKFLEIEIHTPKNPYWKTNGILIKDFDQHNIIISRLKTK